MKKQSINREYNFPDADLYVQCKERIKYAERDIDHFRTYKYNEQRIEAFKELCEKFQALPNDDELVGEQMLGTEKKNDAREKLKTVIRSLMTRVENKYPEKSGRYRKFGTYKMNEMTDPQMLLCGRRVVRVATLQLAFLTDAGLLQAHIDRVSEATAHFENALHIQQDKVADRDIAVEHRIELGNELYRELVTLCNIGKDIWHEINMSKYENYTIYESNNDQKKKRKEKVKR